MWGEEQARLALLELWATGKLRRRSSQGAVWSHLAGLPWTRRTGRRDEVELVETQREEVRALLDRVWPGWAEALEALRAAGLPVDERGWHRLKDRERAERLPRALPPRLNQRTATAAVAARSKAGLTEARREALGGVEVTRDGLVRLRPHAGLAVRRGDGEAELDVEVVVRLLGELVVTERALRDGTRLHGERPAAILLVENVGAYLDLTPPQGWLVALVPGWDTATVRVFLDELDPRREVPVVHFGDLDPNGVRIARHLRALRPDLRWAIPELWAEYLEERALRGEWPEDLDVAGEPALVRELYARGLWLEQEVIVLDPRLAEALEGYLR
ncbi:Wadjet anti-phage system protein JetD domain-containing protein [Sorangium cellulosum]|uniref:Wadjet protein JetD C-terminal domain-containing protein n=1 Tax=Sorangium cellulosum So0157-2 TaxID=1254432 RepID=S4XTJ6_SORCE|nr:Wadjet anti-phage system protein JetD domain-containing protein [Sorangium cellulosum]AGP36472.1 hypothetical protein SCE1572_19420 [Sorangium cellulosum So0157-2]